MLNKNTWGAKTARPIRSNIVNRHVRPKTLKSAEAKGGQVTKPIILVKICYKLLYVIQGIENSFGKVTSWPQLISEFLVAHAC